MNAMPKSRVHVLRNLYFGDESKFELYAASKTLRPRVERTGGKSLTRASESTTACGSSDLRGTPAATRGDSD